MKKIVLAIAAISLLQATPVWAAEKPQKGSIEVQTQTLSLSEMKKVAEQYVKRLQKAMPEIKRYPFQTVEPSGERWFYVYLSKTAKLDDGEILYTIAIHKETKELLAISKMNDRNYNKGKLTDKEAKKRATAFIKEYAGKDANDYELLSVWREGNNPAGNNPAVNFKSPANEAGKATYTTIEFGHDDLILGVHIEIKSEDYDSWYGKDLDHRKKPGDSLPKDVQKNFEKIIELVPSLKEYPYSFTYAGYDGTYKAGLNKEDGNINNFQVSMQFDGEGELLYYKLHALSENAASPELAKEKAIDFIEGLYGDRIDVYEIRNVYESKKAMVDEKGKEVYSKLMNVEFLSKDDKYPDVLLGVSDSGEVYLYDFIYQR